MLISFSLSANNSVEECRSLLSHCGAREITAAAIARALGMMARTPANLGDHGSQVGG